MSKLEKIIDTLEKLALLGEINQENPFKIKAFSQAAQILQKLGPDFASLYKTREIKDIKGIGKGVYEIIDLVMQNQEVPALTKILQSTPAELFDILELPGIGPKKVRMLWQQLGITTIGELEYACLENRLITLEGFGKKTQETIRLAILQKRQQEGLFRLDQGYQAAHELIEKFKKNQLIKNADMTGELANGAETLQCLDIALKADMPVSSLKIFLKPILQNLQSHESESIFTGTYNHLPIKVIVNPKAQPIQKFSKKLISRSDLLGAFHNHTLASDGVNSLEEMRQAAIEQKLTYLGISDHSQSAFYAGGLKGEELLLQCQKIKILNQDSDSKNCYLLTGVESDILADGALDYTSEILTHLDIVIASVHSRLKQDATQMTERMVNAARNPWTTVIGHPTGRLVLGRQPSTYDMHAFFLACKENNTIVELNANPHRLDLNAIHLAMAKEHGLQIAINADAHDVQGLNDLEYGIMTARRAGLSAEDVINCLPLTDILSWLKSRKEKARQVA